MPNGPIDALLFAHHAIDAEARRIEGAAAHAETAGALADLAKDAAFLRNFVVKHTDGEEVGLYPSLIEKVPNIDRTFLHDHADDKEQFAELEGLVARCRAEAAGPAFTALRRQTVVITEHLAVHIRKENEIVLPLVGAHFDPAAQTGMVGKVLSVFTPADMEAVVPFITRLQTDEGAASYVTVLSRALPPPAFEKAKGWIRDGVPAARWDALVRAVPALGG